MEIENAYLVVGGLFGGMMRPTFPGVNFKIPSDSDS